MVAALFIALYLLVIGVLVIVQNPIRRVNISLTVSILLIGLWVVGVYGLEGQLGEVVSYARMIFALGLLSIAALMWFVVELLSDLKITIVPRGLLRVYYATVGFFAILTSLSPFVVEGITKPVNRLPVPIYGFLTGVYVALIFLSLIMVVFLLIRGYRESKDAVKGQVGAVAIIILVAVLIALTTNLVLPFFLGSSQTALLLPLPFMILLSGLSYLVIKNQLFRIRHYTGRTAYYFATTVVMMAMFIVPLLIAVTILMEIEMTAVGFVAVALTVTLIAVSYHSLSSWFDRITSHIFFRSFYDPTELLGELNRILVTTSELDRMLQESLTLFDKFLGNETAAFLLTGTSDSLLYAVEKGGVKYSREDITQLDNFMGDLSRDIILSDMLPIGDVSLRQYMQAKNISIILRLKTGKGSRKEIIGYMIVGIRKSRKSYNYQDLQVLETMANTLAIAIQNTLHYEATQHFNETLRIKVEEATAELKATNRRLKQMDQTKDEFISLTSHQLRTPLTTIKGYISMLLDGDAGEMTAQQRKLLEEAFNSSQRMVHLISDFLNISRIQTGKFMIELTELNLADILDEEIEQLRISATSRQLTLQYDKPAEFPVMPIDEGKIRQVMMNFIDNAIYYSPAKTTIVVTLSHTSAALEFKVIDQGIGVPKAEQHKLFTKFSRASNARKQRPDGTGIGLFMAKKVIVALGGAIIFKSEEGKGSTFGFRLNRPGA